MTTYEAGLAAVWDPAGMTEMIEPSDLTSLIAPLAGAGPLTVAVMVTSADGRATIDGRVGGLTGEADQKILLGLRELAAAVVVGGTTVRNEGYDRLLDDDARAARRARGLPPEPAFLVVTRTPDGLPEGAQVFTLPTHPDGGPDVRAAWRELRARHGDGLVVCEGGPSLLTMLAAQRVLDQLVLCISPQLVGGAGKRLIEPTEEPGPIGDAHSPCGFPLQLEPLAVATAEGFVFVRYGAAS
jgi:riboflavin biosynthesis pyrimidine reductase